MEWVIAKAEVKMGWRVWKRADATQPRQGLGLGLAIGVLFGTWVLTPFTPSTPTALAGHDDGNCYSAAWFEVFKERPGNVTFSGVEAQIENYWEGTPRDGIVRSIFAWQNIDNFVEAGWWWTDATGSPKYFWFLADGGEFRGPGSPGSAGRRGEFHTFRIDNPTGTTWKWFRGGTRYHQYTFNSDTMYNTDNIYANSEVDNKCDTALGGFRRAKENYCSGCPYTEWDDAAEATAFIDNPCFHEYFISNTNFQARHGSEPDEVCP